MDSHLIFKIAHMTFATVAIGVFLLRAVQLFVSARKGHMQRSVFLIALQHLSYAVLVVTGFILLYQNEFVVKHWFYGKIILFLVLLSASAKAFGKRDLKWAERKAGVFVAGVAFAGLLTLIIWKPNVGDSQPVNSQSSSNQSINSQSSSNQSVNK